MSFSLPLRPVRSPSFLSLSVAAALGLTVGADLHAQQTPAAGDATQTLDSVVVTGSRLRQWIPKPPTRW